MLKPTALILLGTVLLSAPAARAQSLGTVTVLSSTCPSGTGPFPDTTCQRLRVDAPGLPSIVVELRVTEPDHNVPYLGTVVVASGGTGVEFYTDQNGGDLVVAGLLAAGARVVDRKWSFGWFSSMPQIRPQSVRFGTLLKWIYENVHTGGALAATGNSGGAAEIAYALSTWGADAYLDVAAPSSVGLLTRIDYLCTDPSVEPWLSLCPTILPPNALECGTPPCNEAQTNVICLGYPQGTTTFEKWEDSVLHPTADVDYPGTVVHGLFGALDCSVATPFGMLYMGALTGKTTVEFVTATPHEFMSTPQARAVLTQKLLSSMAAPGTVTYCTAGTSSSGCQAAISALGTASASSGSGFRLIASEVEGQKDGLFFFGANGRQANPWGNGSSYQCVVPPVRRLGLLTGTGTGSQCDGGFELDLNAYWAGKPSSNPGAGAVGQAQLWYRDPANTSNQTTSLSDALEFCVDP